MSTTDPTPYTPTDEEWAKRLMERAWSDTTEFDDLPRVIAEAVAARDARVRAEAVAPVLALHRRFGIYELEDSCLDTSDEHREEHHHLDDDGSGEFYCDQMPVGAVCEHCRDEDGDRIEWPCPTVCAVSIEQETQP